LLLLLSCLRPALHSFPTRRSSDLVTTLNVLTGAIGLGLGFGLQSVASNFVSGFVLLMDKSIKPGDVISFTTGTSGASAGNFGLVDRKSTRLNSSHLGISYAVFCLK